MARSKPFGGTLSTGQHYLIYNARITGLPRRNALLIAVTRPNELTPLRKVWKIIEGNQAELLPELKRIGEKVEVNEKSHPEATKELPGAELPASKAEIHEWAYPEAVEKDGVLYVVFSQDKRHCWLARIPVKSLALE